MNALETYRKAADQAFRDHGMTDATLEALEAAATKYANERVRAELEALRAKIRIISEIGKPGDDMYAEYDSYNEASRQHIEEIEARLAQLTAEGK